LGLNTGSYDLVICSSKSPRTVSWLGLQNQAGYDLSVVPQNQREDEDDAEHTSRSSDLFCLEASQARVSQSDLKTVGGATQIVHVASLPRLHRVEAKDRHVNATGYIGLFYSNFTVFIVFGPRGILVFFLGL
jgi:hypothetical protein